MYKSCNVVMLHTNQAQNEDNNTIYLNNFSKELILGWRNARSTNQTVQHLYITSDEEIKEGDYTIYCGIWVCKILKHYGDQVLILKIKDNVQTTVLIPNHKKIIATTDTSLRRMGADGIVDIALGLEISYIPESFIKYFIEEYNKGNVISDVEVEYDKATYDKWLENGASPVFDTLKVNPDNTINIKTIKDSWNKDELPIQSIKEIIRALKSNPFKKMYLRDTLMDHWIKNVDKWIEENL